MGQDMRSLSRITIQCAAAVSLLLVTSAASGADNAMGYGGAPDCRVAVPGNVRGAVATWTGACKDGFASGAGAIEWHRDGKRLARYEGDVKLGFADGKGYLVRDIDGTRYEGDFLLGAFHGTGTLLTMLGRYDGQFHNGKPNGHGKMIFALGGEYDGEWRNSKFNGTGTARYPSGRVVTAEWVDGIRSDLAPLPEKERKHYVKADSAVGGSRLRRTVVSGGVVPFSKSYENMSEDEQRTIESMYPLLDDGDEPPYPEGGTKAMYSLMAKGTGAFRSEGTLTMLVEVGADGMPTQAMVYSTPDKKIAEFAMWVMMKQKFKPGTCGGKPCTMKFPVSMKLTMNY